MHVYKEEFLGESLKRFLWDFQEFTGRLGDETSKAKKSNTKMSKKQNVEGTKGLNVEK